jgi:transcriptional antiterminator NusG
VTENQHNASQLPDEAAIEAPIGAPHLSLESEESRAAGGLPAHDAAPHDTAPHDTASHDAASHDDTLPEAVDSDVGPPAEKKPARRIAAEDEERGPIEETPVVDEPPKMNWYILKVQSNREESIRDGLQRRVAVAGLERYFGDVIVPTEMVSEFKGGKKRVVKRKLYPGYLVVNMEINEDTWFLVRETPGIGDFTGSAGKPTPMLPHEVSKIVAKQEEKTDEAPKLKINFNVADRVKINEGTFENFEGEVDSIDEASGRVTVMINIFGRSTPVELEYWQIEAI